MGKQQSILIKYILIFIKAILIGIISCAIPGVSASTFAIILSLYYPMITALSSLFKDPKHSIPFLIVYMAGYFIGAILSALLIDLVYNRFPIVVCFTILGFIFGSIPVFSKEALPYIKSIANWVIFVVIIVLFVLYSIFVTESQSTIFEDMQVFDYIKLALVGLVTSATLVVPGIDFAVVLLALGYYYPIMSVISNLATGINVVQNLLIICSYLFGYGIGAFVISKLIKHLFSKQEGTMKFVTIALLVVSPYMVIKECIIPNASNFSVPTVIIGIIGFIITFIISYKINNSNKQETNEQPTL